MWIKLSVSGRQWASCTYYLYYPLHDMSLNENVSCPQWNISLSVFQGDLTQYVVGTWLAKCLIIPIKSTIAVKSMTPKTNRKIFNKCDTYSCVFMQQSAFVQ